MACNQNAVVAHDRRLTNSTEPIYENIPLPWQNDGEMRGRAQSINSGSELNQVINHSVVNSVQKQIQKLNLSNSQGMYHYTFLKCIAWLTSLSIFF